MGVCLPPCQWAASTPTAGKGSQRQTRGDRFRYRSPLTHTQPFTSLRARWPSHCSILTRGNKPEYKKSAPMTARAMISFDALHRAEASSGRAGQIGHQGPWSNAACWRVQETRGPVANAQPPDNLRYLALLGPGRAEGQRRKEPWRGRSSPRAKHIQARAAASAHISLPDLRVCRWHRTRGL